MVSEPFYAATLACWGGVHLTLTYLCADRTSSIARHTTSHDSLVKSISESGCHTHRKFRTAGIELVNIVRTQRQADHLTRIGAKYVCNSSALSFCADLTSAISATGATLAFDATGGGRLASEILAAMERAANLHATAYSRYGSSMHKQVYIYGGLDRSATTLDRDFGMAWGVGGWLLTPFLQRIGPAAADRMRQRVATEIKSTFASHFTAELSLDEALTLEAIGKYSQQATGEKYFINPNKPLPLAKI